MPQPVSRLFASETDAQAAVSALKARGFAESDISLVRAGADSDEAALAATIAQSGVAKDHAAIFAKDVAAGSTLVSVQAPFGSGAKATSLLAKHGGAAPAQVAVAPYVPQTPEWDDAAPLSSWLKMPVLSSDPAPYSSFWNWALRSDFSLSKKFGWPELSARPAPLSASTGSSVLSDNPTPLSKSLGWSTLSADPTPLSTKMGRRVLSDDPAPLSTKMGWRVLSDNPAPLSSWLGWPTTK